MEPPDRQQESSEDSAWNQGVCVLCERSANVKYSQRLGANLCADCFHIAIKGPPCGVCHEPLSDDLLRKGEVCHPQCSEEAEQSASRDSRARCRFCGLDLAPDAIVSGQSMHEGCQNIFGTSKKTILEVDDSDPILFCHFCGKRVEAALAENSSVPGYDYPLHPQCADIVRNSQ